jgi:hypothetical protein
VTEHLALLLYKRKQEVKKKGLAMTTGRIYDAVFANLTHSAFLTRLADQGSVLEGVAGKPFSFAPHLRSSDFVVLGLSWFQRKFICQKR